LAGNKICWPEIKFVQSTQLRSDLVVLKIPPLSCAGESSRNF